ncbi:unnamed protein product [Echinostoma caproni]|uniref:Uncharacterized protein n=1 Tax=Echinostoma caproni TaxID=27848 RepID=A0A3P8HQW7_9TREM|nr:unnamed protein product [Echinostoma caproni]
MKAALKAHSGSNWHGPVPLVLLGIRNTIKADLHTTLAALAFDFSLRLPGELVAPTLMRNFNYADFAHRLGHHMREVHAATTRQQRTPVRETVSLDRLKPAFLEGSTPSDSSDPPSDPAPAHSPSPPSPLQSTSAPSMPPSILVKRDRRGREVRRPVRFDC